MKSIAIGNPPMLLWEYLDRMEEVYSDFLPSSSASFKILEKLGEPTGVASTNKMIPCWPSRDMFRITGQSLPFQVLCLCPAVVCGALAASLSLAKPKPRRDCRFLASPTPPACFHKHGAPPTF